MLNAESLALRQSLVIIDQLEQIRELETAFDVLERELEDSQNSVIGVWEAQARNLEDRLGDVMSAIGGWIDGDIPSNAGGNANVVMTWADYNRLRAIFNLDARQPKRAAPSVGKTMSVAPSTEAAAKLMNHGASQLAALLDTAEDE